MPNVLPVRDIERAEAAVVYAREVRRYHGRRSDPRAEQRQIDLTRAQERLAEAMAPLRSEQGRFAYGPQTSLAEENRQAIRDASDAIQRERRKIWKMQKAAERKAA